MNEFDRATQATIRLIEERQKRHATLTQKMDGIDNTWKSARTEKALAICLDALKEHLDD